MEARRSATEMAAPTAPEVRQHRSLQVVEPLRVARVHLQAPVRPPVVDDRNARDGAVLAVEYVLPTTVVGARHCREGETAPPPTSRSGVTAPGRTGHPDGAPSARDRAPSYSFAYTTESTDARQTAHKVFSVREGVSRR